MRLKFIIGILVSIFILTNVASAAIDSQYFGKTYVLDQDTESGKGVAIQDVTVTILDSNTVQFNVKAKSTSYPTGYFEVIGLPLSMHIPTVTSDPNEPIAGAVQNEAGTVPANRVSYEEEVQLGGLQYPMGSGNANAIIFDAAYFQTTGHTKEYFNTVTVTLTDDSTFNPVLSTTNCFGAHVLWDPEVNGLGSAWFAGMTPNGSNNIPEFPTIAAPVAAILGLMFIFGRRKKE